MDKKTVSLIKDRAFLTEGITRSTHLHRRRQNIAGSSVVNNLATSNRQKVERK